MTPLDLYALAGVVLFVAGLHAVFARAHLVWKVLGVNVAGSGIFLVLLAAAPRLEPGVADPVPQAMVLTGIVVAVAATAVALGMALRVAARTGVPWLPEADPDDPRGGGPSPPRSDPGGDG